MFGRKKKDDDDLYFQETNDILIVFDDEKKTSDIKRVTKIYDGKVYVQGFYNIPFEDCEITNSTEGRNFFYRAPTQSIKETERLAQLEQSIVLSQITKYKNIVEPPKIDWTKIGLLFLLFAFIVVFGAVACSNGKAAQQEPTAPAAQTTTQQQEYTPSATQNVPNDFPVPSPTPQE